jgi:hypothetical protein
MIRGLSLISLPFIFMAHGALAGSQSWRDGVYIGNVVDLFQGETPETISFVKAHSGIALGAREYLAPCPTKEDQGCLFQQKRFILDYIAAFHGDQNSQDNIATVLAGGSSSVAGVQPNPVRSCAWRIAIMMTASHGISENDLDQYNNGCWPLSASDRSLAQLYSMNALVPVIRSTQDSGKFPYSLVDNWPGTP